ncbi:hypothetical protein Pcac1_g22412 [Phytophthora cactorum]|nr:hypothetical protein Pcac1_g22412 [Phytophthora cactorum]RAW40111.1 hypothetical protein PC110_g3684 [Phytophthora cactorum]
MVDRLAMMRKNWSNFAVVFTETANKNKHMTLQCAKQLHSHMQLDRARNDLEIAAGAGLGSLDVSQHLFESKLPRETKRTFTVTDLSPVMVRMAKENFSDVNSRGVCIKFKEANGHDLAEIATGSMGRYVASLCLQLAPDPDAMLREAKRVLTSDGIAGHTIWGSPERSPLRGHAAANKELGLEENTAEHSDFIMRRDLPALHQRFAQTGFNHVGIWPF